MLFTMIMCLVSFQIISGNVMSIPRSNRVGRQNDQQNTVVRRGWLKAHKHSVAKTEDSKENVVLFAPIPQAVDKEFRNPLFKPRPTYPHIEEHSAVDDYVAAEKIKQFHLEPEQQLIDQPLTSTSTSINGIPRRLKFVDHVTYSAGKKFPVWPSITRQHGFDSVYRKMGNVNVQNDYSQFEETSTNKIDKLTSVSDFSDVTTIGLFTDFKASNVEIIPSSTEKTSRSASFFKTEPITIFQPKMEPFVETIDSRKTNPNPRKEKKRNKIERVDAFNYLNTQRDVAIQNKYESETPEQIIARILYSVNPDDAKTRDEIENIHNFYRPQMHVVVEPSTALAQHHGQNDQKSQFPVVFIDNQRMYKVNPDLKSGKHNVEIIDNVYHPKSHMLHLNLYKLNELQLPHTIKTLPYKDAMVTNLINIPAPLQQPPYSKASHKGRVYNYALQNKPKAKLPTSATSIHFSKYILE